MTTFVLVHGGATTAGYWDLVAPKLGERVLAPDLPGRRTKPGPVASLTVDEAAASLVADVEAAGVEGDLVVVAHSSGGLEVPGLVEGIGPDRVRAIVLNAASIPPEGGNGFDCMQLRHRELALQAHADAVASGTMITTPKPTPESLRRSSGEILDDEQLAFMADPSRCVEDSFHIYAQPVHWSKAAGVPTTYLVNLRDRAVPPELQREMAARLPEPPTVVDLDSGHLPAVTHPDELVAAIRAAVR